MAEIEPIKDPTRSQQRLEFLATAFRGLLAIHGGAAIALLAFLQAIYKDNPDLAKLVLVAILGPVIGLVLAIIFMILRYFTSLEDQRGNPNWKRYQKAYYVCMWMSLVCFLLSMLVVVIGGMQLL